MDDTSKLAALELAPAFAARRKEPAKMRWGGDDFTFVDAAEASNEAKPDGESVTAMLMNATCYRHG